MGRGGRRPESTREQRERVRALASEGLSQRQIAEDVFGDRRYHGRVQRILRALPARELPGVVAPLAGGMSPAAYRTSEEVEQRWADLLDNLRTGPTVEEILKDMEQGPTVEEILRDMQQGPTVAEILQDMPEGPTVADILRDMLEDPTAEQILRDLVQRYRTRAEEGDLP